jgi:hypothetical protein
MGSSREKHMPEIAKRTTTQPEPKERVNIQLYVIVLWWTQKENTQNRMETK